MRACIYVTDPNWLSELEAAGVVSSANFWRKDQRRLSLQPGDLFYFKLKGSQVVAGRGYFREQRQLSVADAWARFGISNGVRSEAELHHQLRTTLKYDGNTLNCLVIDCLEILPENARPVLDRSFFQSGIMNCKFFEQGTLPEIEGAFGPARELAALIGAELEAEPSPFDPEAMLGNRIATMRSIYARRGQATFRAALLKAYCSRCCVTAEGAPAVLEAAHIFPYCGSGSNVLSNGLLLRSDWHTLFDLGLWTIDDNYCISISKALQGSTYAAWDRKMISLPVRRSFRPSLKALRHHRSILFSK